MLRATLLNTSEVNLILIHYIILVATKVDTVQVLLCFYYQLLIIGLADNSACSAVFRFTVHVASRAPGECADPRPLLETVTPYEHINGGRASKTSLLA